MSPEFRVTTRISRPLADVFDAVVNPKKLSAYFVTTGGGANAPLREGTTVVWWGDVSVEVDRVVPNDRIELRWDASTPPGESGYKTKVEMSFAALDDGGTMVTIAESGWRENENGVRKSYLNCEGWTQMLCCLKAYVEHGINLREGYYRSEMHGEPAREHNL
ncbi:SRPBCC domain-containing protein [Arvimicrobium flavum]|uniref:SRPBCC domain-containing protein n=1 Tax=Arvimicrobium flavum TaxID=3393320 RepID=UPI00237B94F9|nr:SRPBCC domain-containing protein [Mesorhizobium shangrilense]